MENDPSGLTEYLDVVRRRRWWIVATAVLVAIVSLLLTSRQDAVYTSTAEVLVLPLRDSTLQPVGQVEMETEARIAGSSAVAAIATSSLGDTSDAEVDVEIENPPDTETLVFTAASTDPVVAKATAGAFAEAYVSFRSESLLSSVASATEALREAIDGLNNDIAAAQARLRQSQGAAAAIAQIEVSTLVTERTALESQLNSLAVAANVRVGEILEPASDAESPETEPRSVGLGLVVGALFGLGLAFIRERLDPRFTARQDLEEATGTPVLAMIPMSRAIRNGASFPNIDPYANEAFRALRARMLHAQSQYPFRSVMVTSATRAEGKGTVATNLALALAEADRHVILVSGDLRAPTGGRRRRRRRRGHTEGALGLTDVLAGTTEIGDVIRSSRVPNLRIVPSGRPIIGEEAPLLAHTTRTRAVLNELVHQADIVLVDATPVLGVSDALELAPLVDAVLLTVDAANAARAEVEDAMLQLRSVGAPVLGTVVTKVVEDRFRGYHHRTYGRPVQPDTTSNGAPPRTPSAERPDEFGVRRPSDR